MSTNPVKRQTLPNTRHFNTMRINKWNVDTDQSRCLLLAAANHKTRSIVTIIMSYFHWEWGCMVQQRLTLQVQTN